MTQLDNDITFKYIKQSIIHNTVVYVCVYMYMCVHGKLLESLIILRELI